MTMQFEAIFKRQNRSDPSLSSPSSKPTLYHSLGPFTGSDSIIDRQMSGPLTSPTENTEEVDTSSRPRLTQEQITILEQEFSQLPKPSTDFKKQLADQIGLTLARVNNWYQNRRAKTKNGAKHTEAQFEVRTEDLQLVWPSYDQPFQGLNPYFDMGASLTQSHEALNPSPPAIHTSNQTNYFGGDNFDFQFDALETDMPEVVPASGHHLGFSDMDLGPELCPPGFAIPSECKMPVTETVDFGLEDYSPDTTVGFAIPEDLPNEQTAKSMYHVEGDEFLMGNLSNQTFMSATSSSDGEQPRMLTPPEKPSPVTLIPQDASDRRSSITGSLASDFQKGFHLQRQTSRQISLEKSSISPSAGLVSPVHDSPMASPVQWRGDTVPPTLSLNTTADSTAPSNRIDIAARRKRPRPAPLVKPDTQRSHSYTGPLTSSPPSSRRSLLNPSQPVRRIRSNLDVLNGRVQKPRSTSAQHSPRNIEAHFHNTFTPEQSVRSGQHAFQSPPTPLSAVYANDESGGYPSQGGGHPNRNLSTPTTFDGSFSLNSPPTTPFEISPFSTGRIQGNHLGGQGFEAHQPPQSAPPQKTHFFLGDSPPTVNSNLGHLSWQTPQQVPSNHVSDQGPAIIVQSQYQQAPGLYEHGHTVPAYGQQQAFQSLPQHQVPSQLHTSFAHSQPQFHPTPEQIYQQSHQYSFSPYYSAPVAVGQQNVYELQTQQQPLEIKVELGPQPKGPVQPRKQYTFNNSTPDDFSAKEEH